MSHHKPLRLPSAFTVNHDLEGATFHRWLPLGRPPQGGRHPAVGVEQALVGRVPGSTRTKTVWSASTVIGGLSAKSRRVFPTARRHTRRGSRCQWLTKYVRVRALPCGAGHRSTRRKHHVFRIWGTTRESGKSGLAFRREYCCLFVACLGGQTLGVNHFTDSAKNPVIR